MPNNTKELMITKKERIMLRSMAQTLPDIVFVGKEGVTENVLNQVEDNLYAHELIKLKVQNTCSEDLSVIAEIICEKCECEVVTIIGTKIVLFKESDKPKIKHVLTK
ncbi:MAG: ribosome assembly RNA-binding protein YhbY [Clostridia bacterium]|nr:ribosome assembly RNA-binding protein YhbY [Clostridia bacterium]